MAIEFAVWICTNGYNYESGDMGDHCFVHIKDKEDRRLSAEYLYCLFLMEREEKKLESMKVKPVVYSKKYRGKQENELGAFIEVLKKYGKRDENEDLFMWKTNS